MAILVHIEDKQQNNFMIYYIVSSPDYPETPPFKAGIDINKKRIYIYKDLNIYAEPIKVITLDTHDPIGECEIPFTMVGAVIKKTIKCFRENDFPNDISLCS